MLADSAAAEPVPSKKTSLTQLSLEELMDMEVTSVSKKPQLAFTTPAAIFVITGEDLRRSGVTTIPDALRLVPGVQVARIDGSKWAVSIRGFNGRFANKLLVLMDGRSVYDPSFSGVYWDIQDTLFADIDRIEVVRGPGGTVWGANAVNGVINIITKSAKETQGTYLAVAAGDYLKLLSEGRYGGRVNDVYYRGYGKHVSYDDSLDGNDSWNVERGGFRTDWEMSEGNNLKIQGDYYEGKVGTDLTRYGLTAPVSRPETVEEDIHGGNLLASYTHQIDEKSDIKVTGYVDHTFRDSRYFEVSRTAFDVDVQYNVLVYDAHNLSVGSTFRNMTDDTVGSFETTVYPFSRHDEVYSAYFQDEYRLIPDLLTVTAGTKVEHNDYSGFEFQPSVRATLTPDHKNTFWGAVTRAVRTPSPGDAQVIANFPVIAGVFPTVVQSIGTEDFESEIVLAYEAGYRVQAREDLMLDVTGFYNEYDNLLSATTGAATLVGTTVYIPVLLENRMEARTYGAEFSGSYQALPNWQLKGSYGYLYMHLTPEPTSNSSEDAEKQSPAHQLSAQSLFEVTPQLELMTTVRYVDDLLALGVPSYWTADMGITWKPRKGLSISLVGQDLFEGSHFEFDGGSTNALAQPRRTGPRYYAKVSYEF